MVDSPSSETVFRLRDAGQGDLAIVLGWFDDDVLAWREWTGRDLELGIEPNAAWSATVPAPGASSLRRYVLERADGLVSGYVEAHLGRVPDDAAMLARLVINPRLRRRGVGRTLLERVLSDLRSRDVGCVSLLVARENVPANRLYRSGGFRGCLGGGSEHVHLLVSNEWKKHD